VVPREGVPSAAVEPSAPVLGSLVGRHRDTIMALTPFVALALFFLTGTWLWFLVIPVVGILLFGADDRRGRNRRRGC
jgi:tellurite resistance protein TehA-like permease